MNYPRFRFSSAVIAVLAIAATVLPTRGDALQLYARAGRPGSNAVANRADSLPVSAAGGAVATDSAGAPPSRKYVSASAEKGSGLSGKVFARFVMPEDWISLASLPGASISSASIQGTPTTSAETVFTMRSFG